MEQQNSSEQNKEIVLTGFVEKWRDLRPPPIRADGLKAVCWLGGFGALLHPVFAFMPEKWPLFVMDGFLLVIVIVVLWHERNVSK
jgi:hypothetical protein